MLVELHYSTRLGGIKIVHDEHTIYGAVFSDETKSTLHLLDSKLQSALDSYFLNSQSTFSYALKPEGSDFQKRVWQALLDIPCGKTKTYGELAANLDTSPRAIGQACKTNPIVLFIPCHRVVSKGGLGGYMGKRQALDIKQALLIHEQL
jgi:methylated-DNA-[protein]-cysteine S-methyltransferase